MTRILPGLLLFLFAGCNTCLDPTSVAFLADTGVPTDVRPGDGDVVDSPDAAGFPDAAPQDLPDRPDASDDAGTCVGDTCNCSDGYRPVEGECVDIDECAELSPCPANATCTNEPGRFTCTCDPSHFGTECRPALVRRVFSQQVSLTDSAAASLALPTDVVDASKVVPFATAHLDAGGQNLGAQLVDVWVDAQTRQLHVERTDADGIATVEISLVEFFGANVQTGSIQLGGTQEVVALDQGIELDRAFLTYTARTEGISDSRRAAYVSGVLGGQEISFDRDNGSGSVTLHWYVVEDLANEFEVERHEFRPGSDACASTPLDADAERTFLLHSARVLATNEGLVQDPEHHFECHASEDSLECCRGRPDNPATPVPEFAVRVTAIEFDEDRNGAVGRGQAMISMTSTATTLGEDVDLEYATPYLGMLGHVGAVVPQGNLANDSEHCAFASAAFSDDGSALELRTCPTVPFPNLASWQAITWPH